MSEVVVVRVGGRWPVVGRPKKKSSACVMEDMNLLGIDGTILTVVESSHSPSDPALMKIWILILICKKFL